MAKRELVSEEGQRLDGRSFNELRNWKGSIDVVRTADGSAFLSQGQTKVLGASEASKSAYLKPKLSVNIFWDPTPFSDTEQHNRSKLIGSSHSKHQVIDRKMLSFIAILKETLEDTIVANSLFGAYIDIHINVLSSDGSIFSCITNAISLALMDAGLPLFDSLCAITVGLAPLPSDMKIGKLQSLSLSKEYVAIADPSGQEEFGYGMPIMTCAFLPRKRELAFSYMKTRIPLSELSPLIKAAEDACLEVQKRLKNIIVEQHCGKKEGTRK